MDIEKLINCIHNKFSKNYNNRDIAKRLWTEVSLEMELTVPDLKKKWANLRDQFRKEFNKHNGPGKSGAAAENKKSSWAYYDSLLYLSKQIAINWKLARNRESHPRK